MSTQRSQSALLLRSFDPNFGFAQWSRLTNPDIYRVALGADGKSLSRIDLAF